jgi:perosamine synthetase
MMHIPKYNSISTKEDMAAGYAMHGPLSGFLGGELYGGAIVNALEEEWSDRFKVKHSIAVNSATSGLLAAAVACEIGSLKRPAVPCFTMSASVAAPMGAHGFPHFQDVDKDTFCISGVSDKAKAIVAVNLFGHPARLHEMREHCDDNGMPLIEDNAQSPLAMEDGKYAGTIGHLGVFSLNVHKHLHCGEGGIVCTNDDDLATRVRLFRNHGELAGGAIGLNLRMVEPVAAIARSQLRRIDELVGGRVIQAQKLMEAMKRPWLKPPVTRPGCTHSFYVIAYLFDEAVAGFSRQFFVDQMAAEGVPLLAGYVEPLYKLKAFQAYARECHNAEMLHYKTMVCFENCAYSPSDSQIDQISDIIDKVEAHGKIA